MYRDIRLIGIGGIGSNLVQPLVKLLRYARKQEDPNYCLTLIDGDVVEEKNLERQFFFKNSVGIHKAQAIGEALSTSGVDIFWATDYVNEGNVARLIPDDCLVILAVDNNKTRHIIQKHCLELNNVMLVNGGNELYDGDVTVFMKRGGVVVMNPIWEGQEQIKNPSDQHPEERSCQERYESDPQLFTTNLAVATEIMKFLTPVILKEVTIWRRKFFDIRASSRVESSLSPAEALNLSF